MDDGSPRVSIIVPSLNTRDLLGKCIESLTRQTMWSQCEVIIVDMCSTDGTPETVQARFPTARVLCDVSNRGYGAACNVGAVNARGQWLLMVNSDVELREQDSLRDLLHHAEAWTGDGVFGVRLVGSDGSPQRSAHGLPGRWALPAMFCAPLRYAQSLNDRVLGHLDESAMNGDTVVGWVTGALLLMRKRLFDQVGGFDESFFMNSEEVDLSARIAAAGGAAVYVPSISVLHHGGGSTPRSAQSLQWLAQGHARYTRKHYGSASLVVARAAAVLAYAASLPVWFVRVLLGRQTTTDGLAESQKYARALGSALHG